MKGLWQDIRRAVRGLAGAPGFTAVAVLTLALAIGGTTAVFSVVDAVLLRSLPFRDPDRVVTLWLRDGQVRRVTSAAFDAWRERSATLESISAYGLRSGELIGGPAPARLSGEVVSASFFDVMGVRPLYGRAFLSGEDEPGADPILVLSHRTWQGALGGDPEIVGKSLLIDNTSYTVVGIAPPRFHGPLERDHKDFWTCYPDAESLERWQRFGYNVFARLRPGVTLDQAQRELLALAAVEPSAPFDVEVESIREHITGWVRPTLTVFFGAVLAVLLIGCLNVAQLQLARAESRTAEFAARKALGASAARLFQQALVESLALSSLGGALGVALAYWLVPVLVATVPGDYPRLEQAAVDPRTLAVALLLTLCSGCFFGAAPAWRLARTSVAEALKRRGRTSTSQGRRQAALLALQVCLSLALLSAAGLLGRRFLTLLPADPGFTADGLALMVVPLSETRYREQTQRHALLESMRREVEAIAGVEQAVLARHVPFSRSTSALPFSVDGAPPDPATRVHIRSTSAGYLDLMQMPLRAGRVFSQAVPSEGPAEAVVNQSFARKLTPDGNALGMTVGFEYSPDRERTYRIVGIVADARSTGSHTNAWDEIYIPFETVDATRAYILARSSTVPAEVLTGALFDRVRAGAPDIPLEPAFTMGSLLRDSVAGPRFQASLIGVFSLNALLLACIGVFGSAAYALSTRRRELGIRSAVGASPGALARTVLASTAVALTAGVGLGLLAAAAVGRALASEFRGVPEQDLGVLALCAGLLAVAALAAAAGPARNASRIDPMEALRHE